MFTDDLKGEIKFGGKGTNESHTGVMGEEGICSKYIISIHENGFMIKEKKSAIYVHNKVLFSCQYE